MRKKTFIVSLAVAMLALGKWLWPFSRDQMVPVFEAENLEESPKIGFVDRGGRTVHAPRYKIESNIDKQGLIGVFEGEGVERKCGWINLRGEVVIPLEWDEWTWTYESELADGHYCVRSNKKWGMIDSEGKKLCSVVGDRAFNFTSLAHGVIPVQDGESNLWGWSDLEGRLKIPHRWEEADDFDEAGMALVGLNDKRGWINLEGEVVIPPKWDSASRFDDQGMALVYEKDTGWGWISRSGEVVIELAPITVHMNHKFGINSSVIEYYELPFIFEMGTFDSQGWALVESEQKWGWIDRKGEVVIPMEWSEATSFAANDLAAVKVGNTWGWIDRKGKMVIEPEWDEVAPFDSGGMAAVKRGDKWGWIDSAGEIRIEPQWNSVDPFSEKGFASVTDFNLEDQSDELVDRETTKGAWIIDRNGDPAGPGGGEHLKRVFMFKGFFYTLAIEDPARLRRWLNDFKNWFRSEHQVLGKDYVIKCYDPDGRFIWSSHGWSIENKCQAAIVVALMVALVTRPGKVKRNQE